MFSYWVTLLVAFSSLKTFGQVNSEIVKVFMDYMHSSLHNDDLDLSHKKMILLKICTLLMKGSFPLLEYGSEALYYFSSKYEGKFDEILKATLIHFGIQNNCLDEIIFNTLLKV
jgi:hypothetical protein